MRLWRRCVELDKFGNIVSMGFGRTRPTPCRSDELITLTFSEFANPDNFPDDLEVELYVLREGDGFLYIGISQRNVWNRWFGNFGRMQKGHDGGWIAHDSVGAAIVRNLPASLRWEIDLWGIEECLQYLGWDYFYKDGFDNECFRFRDGFARHSIEKVEVALINRLRPAYNVTHNTGQLPDNEDAPVYISRYLETVCFGRTRPEPS